MKIRVYYEDTDAGGIVYHTNYIKFCERARSEAFFQKGMMPNEDDTSGFVVRNINASFLSFGKLGYLLDVTTRVMTLKGSSCILLQEVWHDETKLFSMEVVLVYVKEGKPSRIPDIFRELLREYGENL